MSEARAFGRWDKLPPEDEEAVRRDLVATVDHLRMLDKPRLEREKRLMRLYSPDPSGACADFLAYLKRDHPQFNIIKQSVDTMLAMVASQRFMPRYTVVDASWDMGRTSRVRTRVLEGQSEDLDVSAAMYMAALDGYGYTTGHIVGGLDATGKPFVERALPGEVFVDQRACVGGKAMRGHRMRSLPLDVVQASFPDAPAALETSARALDSDRAALFLPRDTTLTEIRVYEGWTAPIGGKPGRHVVCTSRVVLLDEPWEYDVPLVPVHYQKRPVGYWGMTIGEILQDEQSYVDRLLKRIEACHEIDATIFILAQGNQRFSAEQVPGAPARTIRSAGGPGGDIRFHKFTGTAAHLLAEVDRVRERALSLLGISVLDAENKKPAGITSAPGQRTFADLSARRQRQISDNLRDAWLGVYRMLENLNALAQERSKGTFSAVARTTRGLVPLANTVRWADAQLPLESYRLSLQLVSDVPYQVGSRIQQIEEWISSGFTRRAFGQAQTMEGPNEDFQRRETADVDYACWMVERVLDGDFSVELDPHLIPEVAFDVFRTSYLPIKSDGAPEEVLAKLRALIQDALDAIEKKKRTLPGPVNPGGNYAPPAALQLPDVPQQPAPAAAAQAPA